MRLSLNVIPECPIREIVDLAVHAEELGFDRVWVYDEGLVTRDVFVVMSAIAAATTQIEIGPGITNPYTRHPGQTAAAIASLDELSGGRAFLGIGAGGSLTLDPLGLERRRPLTAVRETIDAARALSDANRRFDNPLWRDGYVMTGETLLKIGIGLPALYAQTGLAIAIDATER